MDKLVLGAKELLLLSSQLGASNFFGISDPFFGMTKEEVWSEIPQLQQMLEDKGLVSFGFDGSVELDGEAQNLVSICALCEKYITMDSISCGQVHQKRFFYMRGTQSAEMQQQDDTVTLFHQSVEEFVDSLVGAAASGIESFCKSQDIAHIPREALAEAHSTPEEATQILQKCGCSPEMSSVIAQGLNRTGGYYMITAIDVQRNSIAEYVCVSAKHGMVRLEVSTDIENAWKASWSSREEMTAQLHKLAGSHGEPRVHV